MDEEKKTLNNKPQNNDFNSGEIKEKKLLKKIKYN